MTVTCMRSTRTEPKNGGFLHPHSQVPFGQAVASEALIQVSQSEIYNHKSEIARPICNLKSRICNERFAALDGNRL